ncbi:MAG: DUF2089 domain-containing protein [Bacteroidales bacterium]|nr:DUF2089 domain-containing protein [Bacteroidales bacterium]
MLPCHCPSCQTSLIVKEMLCEGCSTEVHGRFKLPILAELSVEEQNFVLSFVKNSGSLKEMAKQLSLSYPSVRNLLDEIIEKIKKLEHHE